MVELSPESLHKHRVGSLPTLYLVSDWISEIEEASLLREINVAKARWTHVSGRRLQNYGGSVTPKGLVPARLPPWLQVLVQRMARNTDGFGGEAPNHVLVNAYHPGDGIMAHEDGQAYFPSVSILSLGGNAVMRFHRKLADGVTELAASVVLPTRSLLMFQDEAYTGHLHGIDPVHEDMLDETVVNSEAAAGETTDANTLPRRSERISLTVRRVERVLRGLRL